MSAPMFVVVRPDDGGGHWFPGNGLHTPPPRKLVLVEDEHSTRLSVFSADGRERVIDSAGAAPLDFEWERLRDRADRELAAGPPGPADVATTPAPADVTPTQWAVACAELRKRAPAALCLRDTDVVEWRFRGVEWQATDGGGDSIRDGDMTGRGRWLTQPGGPVREWRVKC